MRRRQGKGYLHPKQRNAIIAALRRCDSRSEVRRRVLEKARSRDQFGPRGGKLYLCAECGELFPAKDVQVDHIKPVIPPHMTTDSLSWDEIIARMFCDERNRQVLCKPCHKRKTDLERKMRKIMKDAK